jgi:transposase-like protein
MNELPCPQCKQSNWQVFTKPTPRLVCKHCGHQNRHRNRGWLKRVAVMGARVAAVAVLGEVLGNAIADMGDELDIG